MFFLHYFFWRRIQARSREGILENYLQFYAMLSADSACILALETSCDETAAAVIQGRTLLSHHLATQEIHSRYGGVVPEWASRAHLKNIVPVVDAALEDAGRSPDQIDALAFTQGPGLIGSLMVGVSFAKAFALPRNLPLIGVHHMQAHVLSHYIDPPYPPFPFLCLTVSGGHTQLVKVKDPLNMEILGQTLDDAVGEAFDKVAKMMGLPYPGGPWLDRYAAQGDPQRFRFPKARMEGLNFSFSGIKNAFRLFLEAEQRKNPSFLEEERDNLCASIQANLVSSLMEKLIQAARQTGIRDLGIAGGVSANRGLRAAMEKAAEEQGWNVYLPAWEYCTDNAAMIALAAHYLYRRGIFVGADAQPLARMPWPDPVP